MSTRHPAAPGRASRTRGLLGLRGLVAGATASFGALVAHASAGGTVEVAPGLAVVAATLPLAVLLLGSGQGRRGGDLARIAATAVVAQGVGHLALMLAPVAGAGHEHGGMPGAAAPQPTMVAHHLVVALATIAVAAGLDRALVALARAALARLLPPTPAVVVLPATRAPLGAVVRLLGAGTTPGVRRSRGPPARVLAPLHLIVAR